MGGGSTSADVSRKITLAIEYKYFSIEEISAQVYAKMASITQQSAENFLQKLLAEMTPEDEQYIMQLLAENAPAAGPLREVFQNILDEPVPQRVKERLLKPLLPGKNKPITPSRKKKEIKRWAILKEFDPIQLIKNREKSYKDMFANLFKRGEEEEGVEREDRHFIFWKKRQGLENNFTEQFMGKIREKVRTAAYLRHNYSYWLENIEDGTIILFYKPPRGSPWINRYDVAENWLREQDEARLNIDNIERPNTKWVFRGYSDVDVKVVLDRQPLLGTGPLPNWLRNLAHGRSMLALDTYQDNLCLDLALHCGTPGCKTR